MHIEDQEIDERDTHGLIPVVVVKPFEAIRTPCPPAGTRGEIYRIDDRYAFVRFPLPLTDTEGAVWQTDGDDEKYMRLGFELDEIEAIDE